MRLLHETVSQPRYRSKSRWYTEAGKYYYEFLVWNESLGEFVDLQRIEVGFQDLPVEAQMSARRS